MWAKTAGSAKVASFPLDWGFLTGEVIILAAQLLLTMLTIDPKEIATKDLHQFMLAAVAPRPIETGCRTWLRTVFLTPLAAIRRF
jgi:hypothetical protein